MMKAVVLLSYPSGAVNLDNFGLVDLPKPTLDSPGTFLLKVLYISVDPYMRGRMNPNSQGYVPPYSLNQPMSGFIAGEVVESNSEKCPVSSLVSCLGNLSEYAVIQEHSPMLTKLNLGKENLSQALGVLGMTGVTAYYGLLDLCAPKAGETLVVSGAAGAVGSCVSRIAKSQGCHVIGIAGTDEKKRILVEELGCDAAINYKTENVKAKIQTLAPQGVDMYFDNVGGEITDAVLENMNLKGRISLCGNISSYEKIVNNGPRPWGQILRKGLRLSGFVVYRDYGHRWDEAVEALTELLKSGKLKGKETFSEGIESVPQAFIGLLYGANIGKQLVKLSH